MVNIMSALLSAVCIMFLFWTISHLVRRLIVKDGTMPSLSEAIAIEGSGLGGRFGLHILRHILVLRCRG